MGVNKLSLPHAEVALEATGYERGTITPLGSTTAWPVYADAAIAGRRISMGAGEHGYSAFVDADALTAALGAVVADISEPPSPNSHNRVNNRVHCRARYSARSGSCPHRRLLRNCRYQRSEGHLRSNRW